MVAGRQLVGLLRPTECGHWYLSVDSDVALGGALLIDPALGTSHMDALAELATAVRAANLPGVLPIADLVEQAGQLWLLTAAQPGPTVRELIDAGPGRGLDAGSAATLLNETAQTLAALHRQDMMHGSFGPSSIVVATNGKAALIDVGLASATGLRTGSASDDIRAWGRLADSLSREWAGDGPAAEMLAKAAAAAENGDLSAARDELIDGREVLPADFIERQALVTARTQWTEFMADYAAKAQPVSSSSPASRSLLAPIPGAAETVVAGMSSTAKSKRDSDPAVSAESPASPDAPPSSASSAPSGLALSAGSPAPAESRRPAVDPDLVHLFRPADREPTDYQSPRAGATVRPAPLPAPGPVGGRRGDAGSRPRPVRLQQRVPWQLILAGVALALAALAGILWWLQRGDEPTAALAVVSVSVQQPTTEPVCDSRVEIIGVVETNGGEGEIHFRWVRNDGVASEVQRVPVLSGETRKELPLGWTFEGAGTYDATATLEIVEPVERSAETTFTYACEP